MREIESGHEQIGRATPPAEKDKPERDERERLGAHPGSKGRSEVPTASRQGDSTPSAGVDRKYPDLHLEELKYNADERRFIISRYTQFCAFSFVVLALGLTAMSQSRTNLEVWGLGGFMLVLFFAAILVARFFERHVRRARNREAFVCRQLGFEEPLGFVWGYKAGVFLGVASIALILVILLSRTLALE